MAATIVLEARGWAGPTSKRSHATLAVKALLSVIRKLHFWSHAITYKEGRDHTCQASLSAGGHRKVNASV